MKNLGPIKREIDCMVKVLGCAVQFEESDRLEVVIKNNLAGLGYEC